MTPWLVASLALLASPATDQDAMGQVAASATAAAAPSANDAGLTAFIRTLRPRALAEGVRPDTFDRETAGLTYNDRVVRLDRAQPGGTPGVSTPGFLPFAPYRRQHVDQAHITKGRALADRLAGPLAGDEARYGVPGRIALSIFGNETGYGSFTGNFDLIRSFATLAYDGRRRELFTAELIATLKLVELGFSRAELKGSWAGATGYPQFLPSAWFRLAVDGDGDGRADIWTSTPDTLASIANYLRDAGWKPHVPWGVPVTVPAELDRAAITSPLRSPRCARVHQRLSRWLSMAEWRARGIVVTGTPVPADREQARLIEPDGPGATAYLVTTNYDAILDYNCSNFYALAVGLLADDIAR